MSRKRLLLLFSSVSLENVFCLELTPASLTLSYALSLKCNFFNAGFQGILPWALPLKTESRMLSPPWSSHVKLQFLNAFLTWKMFPCHVGYSTQCRVNALLNVVPRVLLYVVWSALFLCRVSALLHVVWRVLLSVTWVLYSMSCGRVLLSVKWVLYSMSCERSTQWRVECSTLL